MSQSTPPGYDLTGHLLETEEGGREGGRERLRGEGGREGGREGGTPTLIFFTKLAVLLATSFAACTKCLLATGLLVLLDATLHALHSTLVCLAITVAAAST